MSNPSGDSVAKDFTPPARVFSAPASSNAAGAGVSAFQHHSTVFNQNRRQGSALPGRPGHRGTEGTGANGTPGTRSPARQSPQSRSPAPASRSPAAENSGDDTNDVYELDYLMSVRNNITMSETIREFCASLWPDDARPENLWSREGMFSRAPAVRPKERKLTNMVMGILAKLTPENYDKLKEELLALPIRQSEEGEITEVVKVMYEKAVRPEDELYVELYARLMADLVSHYVEQKSNVGQMIRKAIIDRCQMQFEQPFRLSDDELNDANGDPLANDELEFKKSRLKDKLRSNIKFLGHLFVSHMITEKVVNYILFELLYGKSDPNAARARKRKPEEYELEMFCDLLRKVVGDLSTRIKDEYIPGYMQSIQNLTQSNTMSNRIKFMLQDLLDLQQNQWVEKRKFRGQSGPMTIKEFERTQEQERIRQIKEVDQLLIQQQQQMHNNRGHRFTGPSSGGHSPKVPVIQPQQVLKKEVQLPPMEAVFLAIEGYRTNHVPSQLDDFFQPIPREHRSNYLHHWILRALRGVKREDERQLVGDVMSNLVREKLLDASETTQIMHRVAGVVVEEYEDQPKIFSCWAGIVANGHTFLMPDLHTYLLHELMQSNANMKVLVKMIGDVLDSQPKATKDVRDLPKRFRLLPQVLSFDPYANTKVQPNNEAAAAEEAAASEEEEEEDDNYEESEQHDDLFGALMSADRVASDIELRTFECLLNGNPSKLLDLAKRDPNRTDTQFLMKMIAGIFTFVRLDESEDRRELHRCKDILTTLARPKENELTILIEAYQTWQEFERLPAAGFDRFYEFCGKVLKFDVTSLQNFKLWLAKHHRADNDALRLDRLLKA